MKKIIILCALIATGMIFTNCTDDDSDNIDENVTSPIITIQSPNFSQLFLVNPGPGLGPQTAILAAEASDDTGIESMSLSVTNTDNPGEIIFQQTEESNSDTATTFSISREFTTTIPGVYNVIFTALDTEGNIRVLPPRTFIYQSL